MADLEQDEKPACYKERGSFLSDRQITLNVRLDYAEWSDAHKHIQRTAVRVPAYGATLVPFRWMLRENAYDIAYAKRTPLADDDRRVIVAVGLLSHKGKVEQYDYDTKAPKGHLRAMMWERPIQHSIRPDNNSPGHFIGGIVLPYHAISTSVLGMRSR